MKLPDTKRFKWNYLALAFLIPVISFLMIQIIGGYAPFGSRRALLYSDQYHQYYPFFVEFRKALLSGEGLTYTWSVGLGMDYLGMIAYYLASPLNLLSILVPENLTLQFFCLLTPIKLGLASLFFAIFLKKIFGQDDLSITLFGCFYGLCAWALGYQWNLMWLDTFALLPLVALGTIALLRERKFILYTLTLFLSIYANYYVGFFTCIFVLLLFICYQVCNFRSPKQLFSDLCRIAFFSALAICMTAMLTLPAYAALQTTQSSVNKFPEGFRLNIAKEHNLLGLLDAMRQIAGNMFGGMELSWKEGLPNVYCGVGSVMLAILFLCGKDIKLRDKICSVLLLIFFMVSCIIRQLDYIWHGFHFTNMIPYRFTFLFSFVMLYMAYRAYLQRDQFNLLHILIAAIIAVAFVFGSTHTDDTVYMIYNLGFILLYFVVFFFCAIKPKAPQNNTTKRKTKAYERRCQNWRSWSSLALAGIMGFEIILNVINFGHAFPYTGITDYPRGTEYAESMINYMHEREENTPFYRAEVSHSQTLNDGALNGYNGISTFTSSANVKTTLFMQALGYGAKNTYNRYCFEESSPVANLFLGLKYMIERENVKANQYFDTVHAWGTVSLLENNAYLPLGFLTNPELKDLAFPIAGDRFGFQNDLITAATGIEEDVWYTLPGSTLSIIGTNATIANQSGTGYCSYSTTTASERNVLYTYTADRSGLMCMDLDLSKDNSYTVSVNGSQIISETNSLPQMFSVCDVVPGDMVEVRVTCKENEEGTINIQAAIMDDTVFRQAYDILAASTMKLTKFDNTLVEGTINCNRDGLLYTSIPQNGNWYAEVDGVEVETTVVGDCMVAIPMTEGSHTVTLIYHNSAFSLGWKVTLVSTIIFVSLAYWLYQPKRKKDSAAPAPQQTEEETSEE